MGSFHLKNTSEGFTLCYTLEEQEHYIHSKFRPTTQSEKWSRAAEVNSEDSICVIGLGLGYHISYLTELYPDKRILVLEFNYNYYSWLEHNHSSILKQFENNDNIEIVSDPDYKKMIISLQENFVENVLLYEPSLKMIENEELKSILYDFKMKISSIYNQRDEMIYNATLNLRLQDSIFDRCLEGNKDKVILAAAGPSLTKQLPLLKEAQKENIPIYCVGTATRPLLSQGILPKGIMITDVKSNVSEQIPNGTQSELFYLLSANHNAVKMFLGKRTAVLQEHFDFIEKLELDRFYPKIETGGSVATSLLSLLKVMGYKNIALVGQDLAFTGNYSHALDTPLRGSTAEYSRDFETDDYYLKNKVKSSRNLLIYKKWIEKFVSENKIVNVYNCTEGGAHIKGLEHIPLKKFIFEDS